MVIVVIGIVVTVGATVGHHGQQNHRHEVKYPTERKREAMLPPSFFQIKHGHVSLRNATLRCPFLYLRFDVRTATLREVRKGFIPKAKADATVRMG
jgi:hypothetical protein